MARKLSAPNKRDRCKRRRGFTLIELLVVIAIIAILSVVVILTLNPAELLRQSRDSGRVADMGTLTTALGIFSEDQSSGFLGSSSVVYVSIPDPTATSTVGDQCQGLGLPSLPSAYSYHCAASSTYRNVNGQGWIPVSFSSISVGSPLGSLPIDPLNTSSTRNYYTYTTNGTQYEVTTAMESQKYKLGGSGDVIGPDGSTLSTVYAKGSNLSLEPLDYGDASLVGLWSFNEGTGTVAYDYSGNNATGTWNGTQTGTSGYYSPGKIGPWAGAFNGNNDYIGIPDNSSLQFGTGNFTLSLWINSTNVTAEAVMISKNYTGFEFLFSVGKLDAYIGGAGNILPGLTSLSTNTWYNVVLTRNGSTVSDYVNGVFDNSVINTANASNIGQALLLGVRPYSSYYFPGLIDDVHIYNRALSASEIAAMYAGGK